MNTVLDLLPSGSYYIFENVGVAVKGLVLTVSLACSCQVPSASGSQNRGLLVLSNQPLVCRILPSLAVMNCSGHQEGRV